MTVHRVMGIETEYGIHAPNDPEADHGDLSARIIAAYQQVSAQGGVTLDTGWDFAGEDPLRDARGFTVSRDQARIEQLTDGELPRSAANVVLTNGARLYVDHAHPEYSSPEVTTPLAAVRWDRAGELIVATASHHIAANHGEQIAIYKNNVDGKGAAYGTHENYLVERAVPFPDLVRGLLPFLVTRPIICGAGRVGIGAAGATAGFQISQRADYIERDVGLDTTARRPIVNTRDEPHADPNRWRRLHLINGDANVFEVSTYLKLATTALVLCALEVSHRLEGALPAQFEALQLRNPVMEVAAVSHDPELRHRLELVDGRRLTAVEIQEEYLAGARQWISRAAATRPDPVPEQTAAALQRWGSVLSRLRDDIFSCHREVEWVGKLRFLTAMRQRHSSPWHDHRLAAADIHWSELAPGRGIASRLRAAGEVERLLDDAAVEAAVSEPPEDTRAWFRGELIRRFGQQVVAAGWESIVLQLPGDEVLHRIPTPDPQRGTAQLTKSLLTASPDAAALLANLRTAH